MEKVIYRHPMGRFEVVEREYRALGVRIASRTT